MKRIFTAIAAAIGLATGASAATIDLSHVTSNTTIAHGDTVTGTLTHKCKISIADGATVTLSNVTITTNSVGTSEGSWAGITCLGSSTIILSGVNTVHGFREPPNAGHARSFPAIAVAANNWLFIQGDGSLTAVGADNAAGIGGGGSEFYVENGDSGRIVIKSGDITAIGGYGGAGIGGAYDNGTCGPITIEGGTVTAIGGTRAAGIGGGYRARCDGITINGGVVTAKGRSGGAGIGGGYESCGAITIKGGTIVATGGAGEDIFGVAGSSKYFYQSVGGAGIGGGANGSCGGIVIDGGTIAATGGVIAAGIGSGTKGSCGNITINYGWISACGGGGNVTNYVSSAPRSVTGYAGGAGVGCGYNARCGDIAINGGTVFAAGGIAAAAIGGGGHSYILQQLSPGVSSTCGNISITLATGNGTCVYADAGGSGSIAIGAGDYGKCGEVTLADGLYDWNNVSGFRRVSWNGDFSLLSGGDTYIVTGTHLRGTFSGAGKLTIANGAVVFLEGVSIIGYNNTKYPWAGLECQGDATIYLAGDNMVKGNYKDCPGIHVPAGKTLTFTGSGSLAAYGGGTTGSGASRSAGIGGGYNIDCGNVVIAGGDITAVGGQYAAGIGGGYGAACGSIVISNGISHVTATRGDGASNPIGKGYSGSGGLVKIDSGLSDVIIGVTRYIGSSIVKLDALTGARTAEDGATLTGSFSSIDKYKITIADGATVTLSGLKIYGENSNKYPFAGLTCEGDATIILEGDNIVDGFYYYPGIFVPPGKTLTIKGDGSLMARSSNEGNGAAAGIGGGYKIDCGNIVIEGGSITAIGGDNCPGIGGGHNAACGDITIGPGIRRVEATRGPSGLLPIGRSETGTCGTITVDPSLNDRTATSGLYLQTRYISTCNLSMIAEDTVFSNGAILTGTLDGECKISLLGGTVTLRDVSIYGMDIESCPFAGITCIGDTTLILEGENFVQGFLKTYPGIHVMPGKTLTIKGSGSLTAQSHDVGPFSISNGGAGIGGGYKIDCGNIVIEDGVVNAAGDTHAAGIGSGMEGTCGSITIKGGDVTATGGTLAAGIGTGTDGTCGKITITGGTVDALGNSTAAGIGGGGTFGGTITCGDITIDGTDTRVVANGGEDSAYSVGKGGSTVTVAGETGPRAEKPFLYPMAYIQAGRYFKKTLAAMGYEVPTDGTPYSVKALGLPAGLKLKYNAAVKNKKGKVVTKAKSTWWIEGVPTAALDYVTTPAYLVITVSGKTETLPLLMDVKAQKVKSLGELPLGVKVTKTGTAWLEGFGVGWTLTGLPKGLKYTAKYIKKVAEADTVYGTPTKAGVFTITAKKKVGGYYETLKYKVTVPPKAADAALFGALENKLSVAHDSVVNWNLKDDVSAQGGNVVKVTGLPPGLTFAAKDTYAYTNPKKQTGKYLKQTGQTIVGTPTKAGTYVVTFTKNVKSGKKTVAKTAQIFWKVEAYWKKPTLDFNNAGGEVAECSIGLKYGELMEFRAAEGVTVTASGLPKGIALVDLGGGKWGFKGYTTKAGTYLVTVKATLNGNAVTQRIALKVNGLPAWAKGSFNGGVTKYSDNSYCGLATVSVTSAGKISGKLFYDDGDGKPKTWTFSAPCFSAGSADKYSVDVTAKYAYKVKEKVKGKWTTVTKYLKRPFSITVQPGWGTGGGVSIRSDWNDSQIGEYGEIVLTYTCQNLWGSTYKTIGAKVFYTSKKAKYKVFKYTVDVGGKSCALSVKVTTAGKATATLTYDTGKKSKGKTVYYKPTCSTVVLQYTTPEYYSQSKQFGGEVDLYFAPSAGNNFPGWGGYEMVP